MAVREIPAAFEMVCDGCGAVEKAPTWNRPKYWSDFHILRDAYDYQGCAVADGSVKLLLCLKCGEAAAKALNETLERARTPHADEGRG